MQPVTHTRCRVAYPKIFQVLFFFATFKLLFNKWYEIIPVFICLLVGQ